MKCPCCNYQIQTKTKTYRPLLDLVIKFLLLLLLLAVSPVIFLLTVFASFCFRADLWSNLNRVFSALIKPIFSWVTLHLCPKCETVLIHSLNYPTYTFTVKSNSSADSSLFDQRDFSQRAFSQAATRLTFEN